MRWCSRCLARALAKGLAAGLACVSIASAGELSRDLQEEFAQSPAGGPLTVLVHLKGQANVLALDDALRQRSASRDVRHREIVRELQSATATQASLRARLEELGAAGRVAGYTPHWISNLIVVRADRGAIAEIAARADVEIVERNFRAELIGTVAEPSNGQASAAANAVTPGLRAIRAPECWHELGVNGEGVLVANLDTGVDSDHPALRRRWRGYLERHPWQSCWFDAEESGAEQPLDRQGHGTHVMGTITGLDPDFGDSIGVAWGAQWIAANGLAQTDDEEIDNDIIRAYEWFADPDGDPETIDDVPDVIQNSWGVVPGFRYLPCDASFWRVIDNVERAGAITTWSAGNEGPGPGTLRSPADRADTPTNCFSIGAIDAAETRFPFPIANFSSRGPSQCETSVTLRVKPEVVAPGVNVRSSVPGGGYGDVGWSGTSMAGPHVAGVVALLRQVAPDLDAVAAKQILIDTARDLGEPGEDNTYGYGLVDAYAAVLRAADGYGAVAGQVRNASRGFRPVADADVRVSGTSLRWRTDESGRFRGALPIGERRITVRATGFAADSALVEIAPQSLLTQNLDLADNTGPTLEALHIPLSTPDSSGTVPYSIAVSDPSDVQNVTLHYRARQDDPWTDRRAFASETAERTYTAPLVVPETPRVGLRPAFYFSAVDHAGFVTNFPTGAPDSTFTLQFRRPLYAFDGGEALPGGPIDGEAAGWSLGVDGDDARAGRWTLEPPVGTRDIDSLVVQPYFDASGTARGRCFVTGNGTPEGSTGEADVDFGCTTLLSPRFDLHGKARLYLRYARWYAESGLARDDTFYVDLSSDDGTTWTPLETVPDPDPTWRVREFVLEDFINPSATVRLRFRACDRRSQGVTEAAIDDIAIEELPPEPSRAPVPEPPTVLDQIYPPSPNPASSRLSLQLRLAEPASIRADLVDASGRLVRAWRVEHAETGLHRIDWDGRNKAQRRAPAGVYWLQVEIARDGRAATRATHRIGWMGLARE